MSPKKMKAEQAVNLEPPAVPPVDMLGEDPQPVAQPEALPEYIGNPMQYTRKVGRVGLKMFGIYDGNDVYTMSNGKFTAEQQRILKIVAADIQQSLGTKPSSKKTLHNAMPHIWAKAAALLVNELWDEEAVIEEVQKLCRTFAAQSGRVP